MGMPDIHQAKAVLKPPINTYTSEPKAPNISPKAAENTAQNITLSFFLKITETSDRAGQIYMYIKVHTFMPHIIHSTAIKI